MTEEKIIEYSEYVNNYDYITTIKELKSICKDIKNSTDIIAIDTEFIRRYTYYPILCLIQVNYFSKELNSTRNVIIDALSYDIKLDSFFKILSNKKIKKVIHSFTQDIDALFFSKKIKLNNVDDTQVMAEFCGLGSNLGYATLIEKVLNIDFIKDKKTQHSNWKKRPLSSVQKKYAVEDVVYLIPIYRSLLDKVQLSNNYEYYINEIKYILKFKDKNHLINNAWRKIKFDLNNKCLDYILLVKELCKWREKKAINENIIRTLILSDNVLEKVAEFKPKTLKEFNNIFYNDLAAINITRKDKKELLEIINTFIKVSNSSYKHTIFYTNEKHFLYKNLLDILYNNIKKIADEHQISINVTINKTDIIALIMKYEYKKNILYGWKYKLFNSLFK